MDLLFYLLNVQNMWSNMIKSYKGCANSNTNNSKTELNKTDYTNISNFKTRKLFF